MWGSINIICNPPKHVLILSHLRESLVLYLKAYIALSDQKVFNLGRATDFTQGYMKVVLYWNKVCFVVCILIWFDALSRSYEGKWCYAGNCFGDYRLISWSYDRNQRRRNQTDFIFHVFLLLPFFVVMNRSKQSSYDYRERNLVWSQWWLL